MMDCSFRATLRLPVLLLPILVLLQSCGLLRGRSGDDGESLVSDPSPIQLSAELVFSDPFYPVEEPQRFAIHGQAGLDELFAVLGRTRKPAPEPPVVNFKKEMLWVVCKGANDYMHAPMLYFEPADSILWVREQYAIPREVRQRPTQYYPIWIYRIQRPSEDLSLRYPADTVPFRN